MNTITFVTGNPAKADFLSRNLGIELSHRAVDVDELQSLDARAVVEAKARAAYQQIGSPVIVEDTALYFDALDRLPGTFIKWFELELGYERICQLLDGFEDRSASAEVYYCYYDGSKAEFFSHSVHGEIPERPRGTKGFGFDPIFIHAGMDRTRAELDQEEQDRLSPRHGALMKLKTYLLAANRTNTVQ
jgi:inosine triphosphate pyrophosphatase